MACTYEACVVVGWIASSGARGFATVIGKCRFNINTKLFLWSVKRGNEQGVINTLNYRNGGYKAREGSIISDNRVKLKAIILFLKSTSKHSLGSWFFD